MPETQTNNVSAPNTLQAFGVVDDFGRPVETAYQFRSGRQLTEPERLIARYSEYEDYEDLPGRWFYGGVLHPHFGHFITECVHRLVDYTEAANEYDGVIFLKSPQKASFDYDPLALDYVREVLVNLFRIDPQAILLCDRPTRVERLVAIPQHHQLGSPVSRQYLHRLQQIETQYLEEFPSQAPEEFGPKLFLSRSRYIRSGRSLGMTAIEDVYADNGFTILCPETLSFRDQLAVIATASDLVVEAGSAVHILDILGPRKASLTVLSRRGHDSNYWRNAYANRVEKAFFFDAVLPLHNYTGHGPGAGFSLINPQSMRGFLLHHNLLERGDMNFVGALRDATFNDMRMLDICLPKP